MNELVTIPGKVWQWMKQNRFNAYAALRAASAEKCHILDDRRGDARLVFPGVFPSMADDFASVHGQKWAVIILERAVADAVLYGEPISSGLPVEETEIGVSAEVQEISRIAQHLRADFALESEDAIAHATAVYINVAEKRAADQMLEADLRHRAAETAAVMADSGTFLANAAAGEAIDQRQRAASMLVDAISKTGYSGVEILLGKASDVIQAQVSQDEAAEVGAKHHLRVFLLELLK